MLVCHCTLPQSHCPRCPNYLDNLDFDIARRWKTDWKNEDVESLIKLAERSSDNQALQSLVEPLGDPFSG